jgi:4-amino-4-deoxy-L-arabinose transferase-like glycosyltransferase
LWFGRFLLAALAVLYLMNLGSTGFLGPDEPRYASIGRAMAETGDLVTPRLDGAGWFEKPPLLYWTTATALRFGLHNEWAARLPLALLSTAFLVFFYSLLRREFSSAVALTATAILGTSVGWIAYTFVAVPDLPMSVALSAALLITIFYNRPRWGWVAGALLGVAILAKGFVPLALFAPAWLIAKGKRAQILAAAAIVAAPWFVLCTMRNGSLFWNEFFWKHHIARFFSSQLEHVQPIWFYVPVLLGGLFPWTPLVALLGSRKTWEDQRVRTLGWWVLVGFLFFSISRGKLPGYLLPLMPALAILLAVALNKSQQSAWWLATCALLLTLLAPAATLLPQALLAGLRRSIITWDNSLAWAVPFVVMSIAVLWLARRGEWEIALLLCGLTAAVGAGAVKSRIFPALDERVSVRVFWTEHQPQLQDACLQQNIRREWEYGLNYYARRTFPLCENTDARPSIGMSGGRLYVGQVPDLAK